MPTLAPTEIEDWTPPEVAGESWAPPEADGSWVPPEVAGEAEPPVQSIAATAAYSFPKTFSNVATGTVGGIAKMADVGLDVVNKYTGIGKPEIFKTIGEVMDDASGYAAEMYPVDERNPITSTVAGGAAQGISLLAGGAAGKALGLGEAALTRIPLALGAAQGANQGIDTARELGVESPEAQLALGALFGGVEVATEKMMGIGNKEATNALLDRFKKPAGEMLAEAAKSVTGEGFEEILAGSAQDWLARAFATEDPSNPGFTKTGVPLPEVDPRTKEFLKKRGMEFLGGAAGGSVFAGAQVLANAGKPEAPPPPSIESGESVVPEFDEDALEELAGIANEAEDADASATADALRRATVDAVVEPDLGTAPAAEGDLPTDFNLAQTAAVAASAANADAPLTAQALVDATAVAAAVQPTIPTPDETSQEKGQGQEDLLVSTPPSEPSPEALVPIYPDGMDDSREYIKKRIAEGLSREAAAAELASRRSEFEVSLEEQFVPGDKVQDESGDIWVKNKSGRWNSEGEATGIRNHAPRPITSLPGAKILTSRGKLQPPSEPSPKGDTAVVLPAAPTAAPAQVTPSPVAGAATIPEAQTRDYEPGSEDPKEIPPQTPEEQPSTEERPGGTAGPSKNVLTDVSIPVTGVGMEATTPQRDATKPEQMTPDEYVGIEYNRRITPMTPAEFEEQDPKPKDYQAKLDWSRRRKKYLWGMAAANLPIPKAWVSDIPSQEFVLKAGYVKQGDTFVRRRTDVPPDYGVGERRIPYEYSDVQDWLKGNQETAKLYGESAHMAAVNSAVWERNEPVSAAAVEAYGIKLPAGYQKQGDLYVFQPETPTPETPSQPPQAPAVQAAAQAGVVEARSEQAVSITVGSRDTVKAANPGITLGISRGEGGKRYTLWLKSSNTARRRWTYIRTLPDNKEEAIEAAKFTARQLASGQGIKTAFWGKDLSGEQVSKDAAAGIGVVDEELSSTDLNESAPAMPIAEQNVGFGKHSQLPVRDLFATDPGYAMWIYQSGTSSRAEAIKKYLETLPEFLAARDEEIARKTDEADRIRAYEERQKNKGKKAVAPTGIDITNDTKDNVVENKKTEKLSERKAKDQIVDIIAPSEAPSLIPKMLTKHMFPMQVSGANATIAAMEKDGFALNGDGAGVGKTRQILAVAQHYADQGKTVVIITENAAIGKPWEGAKGKKNPQLGGSMSKDGEAMGVDVALMPDDGKTEAGNIYISTYNRVTKEQVPAGAVVIFDESQGLINVYDDLKDKESKWQEKLRPIIANAAKAAFYSATPADKPHQLAYLYKVLGFESPAAFLDAAMKNGMIVRVRKFGKQETRIYDVLRSPAAKNRLYKWVNNLMKKAGRRGSFIKREISYEGTDVQFHDTTGTDEASNPWAEKFNDVLAQMRAAESRGYRLLAPNSYILYAAELTKIGDAVRMVKRELAAGRKAVVYFSRINEQEIRGRKMEMGPDGQMEMGEPEVVGTIPSPVDLLRGELQKEGIEFAELHSKSGDTSKSAQSKFAGDKVNVLLASVESGGTGINLDDVTGKVPRTEVFMFAPYRGISTIQAMGRIWRASTIQDDDKPNRYVFVVASDIKQDAQRSAILAKKLQLMSASLGGTAVSKLPMSRVSYDPDQLVGVELPEEGIESTVQGGEEALSTVPLKPVNVKWNLAGSGVTWWTRNVPVDLLEWVENDGPGRTGLDVSVKKDGGQYVAFAKGNYQPEQFAKELGDEESDQEEEIEEQPTPAPKNPPSRESEAGAVATSPPGASPPVVAASTKETQKPEKATTSVDDTPEVGDEVTWNSGGKEAIGTIQRIQDGKAGIDYFGYKLVPLGELTLKRKSKNRINREKRESSKPSVITEKEPSIEDVLTKEEIASLKSGVAPKSWVDKTREGAASLTYTDPRGDNWTIEANYGTQTITIDGKRGKFSVKKQEPVQQEEPSPKGEPSKPPDTRTIKQGDKVKFKQEGILQEGTYQGVNADGTYSVQVKGEKNPRHVSARSLNENNDGSVVEGTRFSIVEKSNPLDAVRDQFGPRMSGHVNDNSFEEKVLGDSQALQRGYPEEFATIGARDTTLGRMANGGTGVRSHLWEHLGDLFHRAGSTTDYRNMRSKVENFLNQYNRYGVQSSLKDQTRNNAIYNIAKKRYGNYTREQFDQIARSAEGSKAVEDVERQLRFVDAAFASMYERMQAFTPLQAMGRNMAIAFGLRRYAVAKQLGEAILAAIEPNNDAVVTAGFNPAGVNNLKKSDNQTKKQWDNLQKIAESIEKDPLNSITVFNTLSERISDEELLAPIKQKASANFALPASRSSMPLDKARAHVFNKLRYSPRKVRVIAEPALVFAGRYDPDGTIVLNASHLSSIEDLNETLHNHENLHDAMETDPAVKRDGENLFRILSKEEQDDIEAAIYQYKERGASREELNAERAVEAIRKLTANRPDLRSAWGRLVESVSLKLKKMFGGDVTRQQAELVAARIVARGLKRLRKGKTGGRTQGGGSLYQASPSDVTRFKQLTASIPPKPTPEQLETWKQEHPAEYKELEAMRERVLREMGYGGEWWHGQALGRKTIDSWNPIYLSPNKVTAEHYAQVKPDGRIHGELGPVTRLMAKGRVLDLTALGKKSSLNEINTALTDAGVEYQFPFFVHWAGNADAKDQTWLPFSINTSSKDSAIRAFKAIKDAGYSAIEMLDQSSTYGDQSGLVRIAIEQSAIKSADPLATDDSGNLIPPDLWGNETSPDIRYGPDANIPGNNETGGRTGQGSFRAPAGGEDSLGISPQDNSPRANAVRKAVSGIDWKNATPAERIKALASFSRRVASNFVQSFPPDLLSVSATSKDGERIGAGVVGTSDRKVLVEINTHPDTRRSNTQEWDNPEAAFAYAYDVMQEESVHALQHGITFRQWKKAGSPGTFQEFSNKKYSESFREVLRQYNSLVASGDTSAAKKIQDALASSWNLYHGESQVRSINELVDLFIKDHRNTGALIPELTRQMAQLTRQDFTTETGWRKFYNMVKGWMQDAIDSLKAALPLARGGQLGPIIRQEISELETLMKNFENGTPKPLYSLVRDTLNQRQREPVTGKEKRGQAFGQPEIAQIHQQQSTEVARQAAQAVFNSAETPVTPESRTTFLELMRTLLDPRLGPSLAQDLIEAGNDMAPVALQDEMATFALRAAAEGDVSLLNMFLNNVNRMSTGTDSNVSKSARELAMRRWAEATQLLGGLDGISEERDKTAIKSGVKTAEMQALQAELDAAKVKIEELLKTLESKKAKGSGKNGIEVVDEVGKTRKKAAKAKAKKDSDEAEKSLEEITAQSISDQIANRLADPEVSAPFVNQKAKVVNVVRELAKTYKGGSEEALLRERLAELPIPEQLQDELVKTLNANLEANKVIRSDAQPTQTAQAIVDGYVRRFMPNATAPQENRTKTRIEQALRMTAPTATRQQVYDTLKQNLLNNGVAEPLADSVAKITADAWQIRRSAAIEEAVEKVSAKWLLQQILKADVNMQQSPNWRQDMMAQWLSLAGFTAREVELAVKVLDKPFGKALADVRVEAAERYAEQMRKVLGVDINGRARLKKAVIPAIQRVQNALRAGSFEGVSTEMAKWQGWKPLSAAELKRLNELDSLIKAAPEPRYKGATPPHYVLKATHEMFDIFKQHVSGSTLENMAIAFHLNLLSGLPTAGVNIIGPPMKVITEAAIDIARAGVTLDIARFQSIANALKTAASTYFKEGRFTAKYDISDRYGVTEITTTREIANLNYQLDKWLSGLKQAVKDRSPTGILKGVFGISDIVRRFLTVADTAGTAAVNAYSLIMGAHQMAKDAGVSTRNIRSMFTEARLEGQRAYSDAVMAGYSPEDADTAAIDARRAAILGGVYDFVSPEKAFLLDRMSRQEGFLAIGRKPVADDLNENYKGEETTDVTGEGLEGGLISRHLFGVAGMNDVLEMISRFKYGGNTPKGKALSTVLGTLMYGLVHVPYRASRHFAAYSPYGFIRYGVKKMRDHQGKENWFMQSMGTPEQEQTALWRAAAGTALMALIASLFRGSDEPEEKDKDYITVTGNGPPTDDPQVRDAWIKQGNQPYHMRGRLFGVPFNVNIGRGGEVALFSALPFAVADDLAIRDKIRGYKSKDYKVSDITDAFSTYVAAIASKGGAGGLIDLSGKNTSSLSSGKGIASAVSNYAANVIPLNRLIQTTENLFITPPDKSTVETTITANIPLARLGNFPALNRMGDPVGDAGWLGKISYMGVPLPIDVEPTEQNKKVYEVIHSKMAAPGRMNRVDVEKKYGELTNRQWYDFVKASGGYLSKRITDSHDKLMKMNPGLVDKWMAEVDETARARAANGLGLRVVKVSTVSR